MNKAPPPRHHTAVTHQPISHTTWPLSGDPITECQINNMHISNATFL